MRADHAEISWDAAVSKWLVRIASGEEVIRRHCQEAKDADEPKLRSVVQKTLQDEGYDPNLVDIRVRR